jgi:transposase-like protein
VGRGPATDRSLLFVLDGAKALHKAVSDVFGRRALIQRCRVHKMRNVIDHLPRNMHRWVAAAIRAAYGCGNAVEAKKQLLTLVGRLADERPSAAASLCEGLDETLTVMRLELPTALERTLCSANAIECLMSRVHALCGRVKRWRGGSMVLRWAALGLTQAGRKFRRVKGAGKGMGKLVAALRRNDARRDAAGSKLEKQREVA